MHTFDLSLSHVSQDNLGPLLSSDSDLIDFSGATTIPRKKHRRQQFSRPQSTFRRPSATLDVSPSRISTVKHTHATLAHIAPCFYPTVLVYLRGHASGPAYATFHSLDLASSAVLLVYQTFNISRFQPCHARSMIRPVHTHDMALRPLTPRYGLSVTHTIDPYCVHFPPSHTSP